MQGSEKEVEVAGVAYVSRVRAEPVEGRIPRAYLPAEEEPHASTLDTWWRRRAVDCWVPLGARW